MFEVGNIVWYIDPKEARVKVCKVVEEIIKKTLAGEESNYVLQIWAGREFKRIGKNRLNGDFYSTKELAKNAMLESAETAIDRMIQRAESEANDLFTDHRQNEISIGPAPQPPLLEDGEAVEVTLEDGTVARVRGL